MGDMLTAALDEAEDEDRPETRGKALVVWLIVVSLVALAGLGVGLYALTRDDSGSAEKAPSATVADLKPGVPTIVSTAELTEYATQHSPVYWAGKKNGMSYELTTTSGGDTYIRYLPEGTEAGSSKPDYLSVATYAVNDAYTALSAAAKKAGDKRVTSQSGALVVNDPADDTRAYFAFPQGQFQVEVFDPKAGNALKAVNDGSIVLVP